MNENKRDAQPEPQPGPQDHSRQLEPQPGPQDHSRQLEPPPGPQDHSRQLEPQPEPQDAPAQPQETPPSAGAPLPAELPPEELYAVGMALYREKRYDEAAPYLRKAGRMRREGGKRRHLPYARTPLWPDAAAALAWMTEHGKGVAADPVQARILYAEAGDAGCRDAMREYVRLAAAEGLCDRGLLLHAVNRARMLGDTQTGGRLALQLAGVCERGRDGFPQDMPKALSWYACAGNWGNTNAAYDLGFLFEHGKKDAKGMRLVEADPEKALQWYTAAAERGHVGAQCACARLHSEKCNHGRYRRGLDRKLFDAQCAQTIYWYGQAARQGDPGAMELCAEWYYWQDDHGRDTPESLEKTLYWYERLNEACASGPDPETLEKSRRNSEMLKREYVATMQRLPEAAAGDRDAQFRLGLCRMRRFDRDHALYWFEQAAQQGDRLSQVACGILYSLFSMPQADPLRGIEWLKKAAAQEDPTAQKLLEQMRRPGQEEYWSVEIHVAIRRLSEQGALSLADKAVLNGLGFGDTFFQEMFQTPVKAGAANGGEAYGKTADAGHSL